MLGEAIRLRLRRRFPMLQPTDLPLPTSLVDTPATRGEGVNHTEKFDRLGIMQSLDAVAVRKHAKDPTACVDRGLMQLEDRSVVPVGVFRWALEIKKTPEGDILHSKAVRVYYIGRVRIEYSDGVSTWRKHETSKVVIEGKELESEIEFASIGTGSRMLDNREVSPEGGFTGKPGIGYNK